MQFRVFILAAWLVGLACGGACGGCGSGGFPVDASLPDAGVPGTVTATWSLTDLAGAPIQCNQVGANTVSLELHSASGAFGVPASFTCANSPSTSQPLDPGTYNVSFELRGLSVTLATAPDQNAVTVLPGQDTRLSPVTFVVDAKGSLVLSLAAPPAIKNCAGGAGMTGTTITLVHTGGGCAPVTFQRARGATSIGTYLVNCSSPQVAMPCIESDETLTVASLPSGPYMIHVRGKLNAADCWKNDDALQVPPLNQTLSETLNLAYQAGTLGCPVPP